MLEFLTLKLTIKIKPVIIFCLCTLALCPPSFSKEISSTSEQFYIVKSGDTVFQIMRNTGVYWKDIIRLNNLDAPYYINPGQRILLMHSTNSSNAKGNLKDAILEIGSENSRSPLGINANETMDDDTSIPFINVFKTALPFEEARPWLTKGKIIYDNNGWPKNLNGGQAGTRFLYKLPKGTVPDGLYTVLYDGEGIIEYGNDAKLVSRKMGSDKIKITAGLDNELKVILIIKHTNSQDHLRNIRVLLPGGICANNKYKRVNSSKECRGSKFLSFEKYYDKLIFNPDYLNYMKDFKVIRFMNMSGITRNPISRWEDRPRLKKATWGGKQGVRGAPLEIMVALANMVNADPWFNIPHKVDNNYVRSYAQYVKTHLKPGLKAYVEYTNEAWNSIFDQAQYVKDEGERLKLDTDRLKAGYKFFSMRSVQIFDIWEQTFGGTSRIVRVMGSWAGWTRSSEMLLSYHNAYKKTDAIAIAPYFFPKIASSKKAKSVGQLFQMMYDPKEEYSIPNVLKSVRKQANMAKRFGVDLIAYEGGQHLVDWKSRDIRSYPTNLFIQANKDARMGKAYTIFLRGWKKNGGKLFVNFSAPRSYQWFGSWGTKEYISQPVSKAPKHHAILSFVKRNPCWWPSCSGASITRIAKPAQNPTPNVFDLVKSKEKTEQHVKIWKIYLALTSVFILFGITLYYFRRYRHPLVTQLSARPIDILTIVPEQLSEAKHRLYQTHRLQKILSDAEVSPNTFSSAINFIGKNKKSSNTQAELLSQRLNTTIRPLNNGLFLLKFNMPFPINVEQCLLFLPKNTETPLDAFKFLSDITESHHLITLIISSDSDFQRELRRKTMDVSNKWVAPEGKSITELLLSPSPEQTLARIISEQVPLTQVSPYQLGGGTSRESMFFGRREIIAHIMNRDPANYLLVAGRQLGKSTLLKALHRRYDNHAHIQCYYRVLSDAKLEPQLARALKISAKSSLDDIVEHIENLITKENKHLVFLIDEADTFIRHEKLHNYKSLNILRQLSEKGHCSFILAGFWHLYNYSVLDYQSPLKNFAEVLQLDALEKSACKQLATEPMKNMGLSYASPALVEDLIEQTGQRANLISISCNEVLKQLKKSQRIIEAGDIQRALKSNSITRAMEGWKNLSGVTEDDRIDRIVVYSMITTNSFTLTELANCVNKKGFKLEISTLERSLARLELAFIVHYSERKYLWRVPLFYQWLREQELEIRLEGEKLVP